MQPQVYYCKDNNQLGPVDILTLSSLYSNGEIDLNTLVWMETMTEWMLFGNSPVYSQYQTLVCPPPPTVAPTYDIKSRNSVKFVLDNIDYRKSIRHKSVTRNIQSVSRTVSQRLTRSTLFDITKKIWIEDKNDAWVLGTIIHQDNTLLAVENCHSNVKSIIDTGFQDVLIANDKTVSDMSSLNYMHEPGILYNLEQRFLTAQPYTYMGLVLLAVNPLKRLPQPSPNDFILKSLNPELPHPYAIAELCCQELDLKNSLNQSVVISGESGSGKTETAKLVLHHLVSRSGSSSDTGQLINTRLLQSSPVLEAFGNSKTARNPNSSRFGKFMKIFLSPQHPQRARQIEGALVETYLLEKGRVIGQTTGEQNYHIFYQLLSNMVNLPDVLPKYMFGEQMLSDSSFRILNPCMSSVEILNQQFMETNLALSVIGYNSNSTSDVWRILGALLLFGNIHFSEEESPEGAIAILGDDAKTYCQNGCQLLGLQYQKIEEMLTQKIMVTRGETFTLRLTSNDACYARDAFCKALYEALFDDIVTSINLGLRCSSDMHNGQYIGVLDVFGFESFDINGFDQLLINYANEALQNTFNTQVFQSELKLFHEEHIDCPLDPNSCPDNSACIETLWASKGGSPSVLTLLDSVCRQPKPADSKFCSQLHKDLGKSDYQKYFPAPHPKDRHNTFLIKHFAGVVKYTVGGGTNDKIWVDRNNDSIPDTLWNVLGQSNSELIKRLVDSNSDSTAARKQLNKPTVSTTFSKSIHSLTQKLQTTNCSFIRCIKPNSQMCPDMFDKKYVVEQMRALGLVQACEVMSVGLPNRIAYVDLKESLSHVIQDAATIFQNESEEVLISALLMSCNVPAESYRLGKTRVFFRPGHLATLEQKIRSVSEGANKIEMVNAMKQIKLVRDEMLQSLIAIKNGLCECEDLKYRIRGEVEAFQNASVESPSNNLTSVSMLHSQIMNGTEDIREQFSSLLENVTKVETALTSVVRFDSERKELFTSFMITKKKFEDTQSQFRFLDSQVVMLDLSVRNSTGHSVSDDALDRWQEISNLEELIKIAKALVKDAELASLKFQTKRTEELVENCLRQFSVIKSTVESIEAGLKDNISRLNQSKLDSNDLLRRCEECLKSIGSLGISFQEIYDECSNYLNTHQSLLLKQVEKERERERESQERLVEVKSTAESTSVLSETEDPTPRRGSIKITKSMMAKLSFSKISTSQESLKETNSSDHNEIILEPLSQVEQWTVPEGWEEYYDNNEGLPYYYNTITQQTQWERPDGPASSVGGDLLPSKEVPTPLPEDSTSKVEERVDHSHGEVLADKCNLNYGRITTAQLNTFGSESKTGYLMKRSGLMGRWKKKFFVLDGAILSYYEKSQHYTYGSGGSKEMRLSTASSTSFTDAECTFIVKSPRYGTGEELSWMLVAETPSSMREWVAFINAHIHSLHCKVLESQTDIIADKAHQSTFWCMLPSCRNPVGVRSLPRADGPRTGEGIYPGEYVEIVQTLETSENTYLKLAEDRGWVFTTHPVHLTELFIQFNGYIYEEINQEYRVDSSVGEGVPVQFSPGNDSPRTGSFLNPKEDVDLCGLWEFTAPTARGCKQFGKLADGRGWVPMSSSRGDALLHQILKNPLSR